MYIVNSYIYHSLPATQGQRTPPALPSDAQTASFPETTTNRV